MLIKLFLKQYGYEKYYIYDYTFEENSLKLLDKGTSDGIMLEFEKE